MKFLNVYKNINHNNIYIAGLLLIAVGMPLSRFLISIGQILLLANWIAEGGFALKWKEFKNNTIAIVLTLFFLVHIAGMLYTEDFSYGTQSLKIKLPMLLIPLVVSTSAKISSKIINLIFVAFVMAVFTASLISFWIYMGMTNLDIQDNRNISIIISNIHFSLLVAMSIFVLKHLKSKNSYPFLVTIGAIWLIVFLFILGSITGILGFSCAVLAVSTYYLSQKIGTFKTASLLFLLVLFFCGLGFIFINKIVSINPDEIKNLETHTSLGNEYLHDLTNPQRENGNLVWINVCWKELQMAWDTKTNSSLNSKSTDSTELKYVLIRYLASKGFTKDQDGINQLTKEDITNIKTGITNFKHKDINHLIKRYYQVVWEFQSYSNGKYQAGHSVTQRLVYWKTAWELIKKDPMLGVGTGDLKTEFVKFYEKEMPFIPEKWRHKSHNQFLTTTVALGVTGLLFLISSLIFPLIKNNMYSHSLYLPFFIIFFISIIPEDGLETQAGVAFYTFFNSLIIFGANNLSNENSC